MSHSAAKLTDALIDGTIEIYKEEPDGTSVNKVRRRVEQNLDLEDGFFTSKEWKQRSKTIIKDQVDKLLEDDASEPKSEPDVKAGIKRQSPEAEFIEPKRRKRKSDPVKKKEELDQDELDEKKATPRVKKAAVRRKIKAADLTDEEEADSKLKRSPSPAKKRKIDMKNESDVEMKLDGEEDEGKTAKRKEPSSDDEKPKFKNAEDSIIVDSKPIIENDQAKLEVEEDDYSDVIDEPHPTKRKKGVKREASSKAEKAVKAAPKKALPADDPQEAEIKKLQSQLSKCGIRKLWHIELRHHGDDSRAKIRHLKKILSDIGIDGRFSEAKAREIKEMRELQADVEAAQEMNRLWGMDAGGRASRSKSKSIQVERRAESDAEDEDAEDDDQDEPSSIAARRRKAHAELAFLGDDSESE